MELVLRLQFFGSTRLCPELSISNPSLQQLSISNPTRSSLQRILPLIRLVVSRSYLFSFRPFSLSHPSQPSHVI